MERPLIGIICDTHEVVRGESMVAESACHLAYAERVWKAGGLPAFIPNLAPYEGLDIMGVADNLLDTYDGFLGSGGYDFRPTERNYGRKPTDAELKTLELDEKREVLENHLIHRIVEARVPYFGICHGLQALNIAYGGNLIADIPLLVKTSIVHSDVINRFTGVHDVTIDGSSKLFDIIGETTLKVNSRHHLCIQTLGCGVTPTAWAPDDIVEAIEMPGYGFVLAVQWHPEDLNDEVSDALFKTFVDACRH